MSLIDNSLKNSMGYEQIDILNKIYTVNFIEY